MKATDRFPGASFGIAVAVNAALSVAIGALLGGLRGGQIGLLAGIALTVLPTVARSIATWLARPDNLARFVVLAVAGSLAAALRRRHRVPDSAYRRSAAGR